MNATSGPAGDAVDTIVEVVAGCRSLLLVVETNFTSFFLGMQSRQEHHLSNLQHLVPQKPPT